MEEEDDSIEREMREAWLQMEEDWQSIDGVQRGNGGSRKQGSFEQQTDKETKMHAIVPRMIHPIVQIIGFWLFEEQRKLYA